MYRRVPLLLTATLMLFISLTADVSAVYLQDTVKDLVEKSDPDEMLPVILIMAERPDQDYLRDEVQELRRRERRIVVWEYLVELAEHSQAELHVFNLLGREVELEEGKLFNAGWHSVQFKGENLSSGIYFVLLDAGDYTKAVKMVLLK